MTHENPEVTNDATRSTYVKCNNCLIYLRTYSHYHTNRYPHKTYWGFYDTTTHHQYINKIPLNYCRGSYAQKKNNRFYRIFSHEYILLSFSYGSGRPLPVRSCILFPSYQSSSKIPRNITHMTICDWLHYTGYCLWFLQSVFYDFLYNLRFARRVSRSKEWTQIRKLWTQKNPDRMAFFTWNILHIFRIEHDYSFIYHSQLIIPGFILFLRQHCESIEKSSFYGIFSILSHIIPSKRKYLIDIKVRKIIIMF